MRPEPEIDSDSNVEQTLLKTNDSFHVLQTALRSLFLSLMFTKTPL